MKIEIDSLKCIKLLTNGRFEPQQTECLVETFTDCQIRNLYSIKETDITISEVIKDAVKPFDDIKQTIKEVAEHSAEARRVLRAEMKADKAELKADIKALDVKENSHFR